jgi:hypothetical protein
MTVSGHKNAPNEVGAADAGSSPSVLQDLLPGPADLFR